MIKLNEKSKKITREGQIVGHSCYGPYYAILCPLCKDPVHPQSVIDGMCEDCERIEYPHGRPLDSDLGLI